MAQLNFLVIIGRTNSFVPQETIDRIRPIQKIRATMPAINKQVQQKPAKPALNLIQAKRQVLKTMVGQTLKEDRILELARETVMRAATVMGAAMVAATVMGAAMAKVTPAKVLNRTSRGFTRQVFPAISAPSF